MKGVESRIAVVVREPQEPELVLCRMLLPEACANPTARHFRLAFGREPLKLVGALAYRDDAIALGGVRVHVIPTERRRGIGAELLDYAAKEAVKLGRRKLLAEADLQNEPAAEPFLVSQGFRKQGTVTFAEMEIADLREQAKATAGQLKPADPKVPAGARVVSLSEAGEEEVTRLYAQHIAHMEPLIGLRDAFHIDQQIDSVALLVDDKLVGFVLARLDRGTLHIPAWVVTPEYRRQSIGRALLHELAKRVRGRVERMQFEFTDVAMVTPRVLHLPGYKITKIAARFERKVLA